MHTDHVADKEKKSNILLESHLPHLNANTIPNRIGEKSQPYHSITNALLSNLFIALIREMRTASGKFRVRNYTHEKRELQSIIHCQNTIIYIVEEATP